MSDNSVDLGLSGFEEPRVPPPAQSDHSSFLLDLAWVNDEIAKQKLPRALLLDRVCLLIQRGAHESQHRTLLEDLKNTLLSDPRFTDYHERIGALVVGSAVSTFTEASKLPIENPIPAETVNQGQGIQENVSPDANIRSESEFSHFAAIVRSLAEDRDDRIQAALSMKPSGKSNRWRLMAVLPVILLLVSALLFTVNQYRSGEVESVAFIPPIIDSIHSTFRSSGEAVAPPQFEQIRDIGAIASLAYDLNNSDFERKGGAPPRAVRPQPVAANNDRLEPSLPGEVVSLPQAIETLSIKESTEPSEVRELQQRPEPEREENVIEFPPYRNKPQPTPPLFGTTAPNGAVLVQRLSPPRLFTTIVATDIRPRPSYVGATIGALPSGDTVSVDTLFGPWARIIMSSGRPGYVLLQDLAAIP